MSKREIVIDEKEDIFSDAVMALMGILTIVSILCVFRWVLLSIANGTLFLPV